MIVVEYKLIELDYCSACHGVWFDSSELGLLLDTMNLADGEGFIQEKMRSPEAKTPEKKRRCPICSRHMRKVAVGDKPALLFDICKNTHGLWFDGGEVNQLVKQLPQASGRPPSEFEVESFLTEVFQGVDTPTTQK
jgi:Zn-finger nucleic acid-binding protein